MLSNAHSDMGNKCNKIYLNAWEYIEFLSLDSNNDIYKLQLHKLNSWEHIE